MGFPYSEWPQDLKDQYAFNVAGAKALLTAAGYSNGFNTDIVAPDNYDLTLLQIVKSDFAAINVNMTIRTMDTTAWTNYVRVTASDDAMSCGMSGLGLSFEPMFQLVRYLPTNVGGDVGFVNDPTYNALYTKALTEST